MSDQELDRPVAIVVAGPPRSGTSALTGVLALQGCVSPEDPQEPTHFNPRGYFESRAMIAFLDRVLASQGSGELDLRSLSDDWIKSPAADRLADEGAALIVRVFPGNGPIAFKNPRIARLTEFVKIMLDRAGYVTRWAIAFRHPIETSRSEARHHGLSLREAELLWLRYCLDAEYGTRGEKRIFIDYASLILDWRSVVDSLKRELDVRLSDVSEDSRASVDNFLTKDLHRQRVSAGEMRDVATSPWTVPAYSALVRLQKDPKKKGAIRKLTLIGGEFSRAVETFFPLLPQPNSNAAAWQTYAPALKSSGGLLQDTLVGGRYRVDGFTVILNLKIEIFRNGDGAGILYLKVPDGQRARAPTVFVGREQSRGQILQGILDGDTLSIFTGDNNYPAFDGANIALSGVFELL